MQSSPWLAADAFDSLVMNLNAQRQRRLHREYLNRVRSPHGPSIQASPDSKVAPAFAIAL
jgi:hypothetical protein